VYEALVSSFEKIAIYHLTPEIENDPSFVKFCVDFLNGQAIVMMMMMMMIIIIILFLLLLIIIIIITVIRH
jgi:hypothetical protein